MSDAYVDATFYAQVEPEWHPYDRDRITGAKVRRTTQTRPDVSTGIIVKVTVRVPRDMFPAVVAVVPDPSDVTAEAVPS